MSDGLLHTRDGHPMRVRDALVFDASGEQVGRIVDGMVYGPDGRYAATVVDGRLVHRAGDDRRTQPRFIPGRTTTLVAVRRPRSMVPGEEPFGGGRG